MERRQRRRRLARLRNVALQAHKRTCVSALLEWKKNHVSLKGNRKRPRDESVSDASDSSSDEDEDELPWGAGERAGRKLCKVKEEACSTARLKELEDVVYVGFDKDQATRVKTHFKNANIYGNSAVLHAYISQYFPKRGLKHEDEVMKFYLSNKPKTWRGRGLCNWNEQKKSRKSGHVYVIVRKDD